MAPFSRPVRNLAQGIVLSTAVTALCLALLSAYAVPAVAQRSSIPANPQIAITYVQPVKAAFGRIYESLKRRQVLETLQQFLAPVKLERKLTVTVDQCGATRLRYKPPGPVTICYEYIDQIEHLAPKASINLVQGPITTESAIVGPVVQALLHEVGIAIFNIMETPVWGRLDDAADRLAAFLMLQFGTDVAWNTVVGTAWFLAGNATAAPDYADVRGVVAQRYYTTLCLAYGGELMGAFKMDPERSFSSFVAKSAAGTLPSDRASTCTQEYASVKQAFMNEIKPHLDPALLEQVQTANLISFGSGN
jgi:hypothetical protein